VVPHPKKGNSSIDTRKMFCAYVTDFEIACNHLISNLMVINFKFTISSRICYRRAILFSTNILETEQDYKMYLACRNAIVIGRATRRNSKSVMYFSSRFLDRQKSHNLAILKT
jgi:hypothetical protein